VAVILPALKQTGRASLFGANAHQVSALTERVSAYGELSIISALLVGAALATLVETQSKAGSAERPEFVYAAEISSSLVLAANIVGTAVILFQKHLTLWLMSRDFFRGARYGWNRGKPLRSIAVQLISWSLPAILVSNAFFVLCGEEITPGSRHPHACAHTHTHTYTHAHIYTHTHT
jgi:hypothetical protein